MQYLCALHIGPHPGRLALAASTPATIRSWRAKLLDGGASGTAKSTRPWTGGERHRILSDLGQIGSHSRVLMLVSGGGLDYVISSAVGWKEDHGDDLDPSSLAFFPPGADPNRLLPGE